MWLIMITLVIAMGFACIVGPSVAVHEATGDHWFIAGLKGVGILVGGLVALVSFFAFIDWIGGCIKRGAGEKPRPNWSKWDS